MSNFPRLPRQTSGFPKLSDIVIPTGLKFIGEQVGPSEDGFKLRMNRLFSVEPRVYRRAYLVNICYGEPPISSVVLCLRLREDTEHEMRRGFKQMFGEIRRSGDTFDQMLIDDEQERELRQVCKLEAVAGTNIIRRVVGK